MKISWKVYAVAQIAVLLAVLALAMNTAGAQVTKVDICHRTASDTNPYVFISVDDDSLSPGHLDNADP
jgi:hypothetical protein